MIRKSAAGHARTWRGRARGTSGAYYVDADLETVTKDALEFIAERKFIGASGVRVAHMGKSFSARGCSPVLSRDNLFARFTISPTECRAIFRSRISRVRIFPRTRYCASVHANSISRIYIFIYTFCNIYIYTKKRISFNLNRIKFRADAPPKAKSQASAINPRQNFSRNFSR